MQMNVDVLVWMTVGIALLSSEAFTGTFHLLFFGLAALLTAVLASLGMSHPVAQMILFAVFSLTSALLLRKRLLRKSSVGFEQDADQLLQMEIDLPPGAEANIRYQGVPWQAVNVSAQSLLKGDTARILRTEGIKLMIEPTTSLPEEKSWN